MKWAEVAELVDALDSGSSGVTPVGVRVPSSAPIIDLRIINGKYIIFPKAIQKPRYKTRGGVGNVGGVWLPRTIFA